MLTRMKRGYSREAYDALVTHVRQVIPGVALSTDIIAGTFLTALRNGTSSAPCINPNPKLTLIIASCFIPHSRRSMAL